MVNNPADLIRISSGIAENITAQGSCALETTQVIAQCNEYLLTVFVSGVFLGLVACGIGVLLGVWYRGRQGKHN